MDAIGRYVFGPIVTASDGWSMQRVVDTLYSRVTLLHYPPITDRGAVIMTTESYPLETSQPNLWKREAWEDDKGESSGKPI